MANRNKPNSALRLVFCAALSLFAACEQERAPETVLPNATETAAYAPGLDFDSLVQRVRHTFRPDGNAFRGGSLAQSVRVAADGAFTIVPLAWTRTPRPPREPLQGMPLTLQTTSIARGGVELAATVGVPVLADDGTLRIERGVAREVIANQERGVEQSWQFDHGIAGKGDLIVRVQLHGEASPVERGDGIGLGVKAGIGLHYGMATWVDAAGKRTTIAPVVRGGAIEIVVPSALADASTYPVVLDPIVSTEIDLGKLQVGAASEMQMWSAVAFDGTNFLVVWMDERDGWDIYGARVTPSGSVLDAYGFPIAHELFGSSHPALAFDGTNFLVVWTAGSASTGNDISAARVSPAGVVLDASPIVLTAQTGTQQLPAVAFNGTHYLAAWYDAGDIRAKRVSVAGSVLDASPITISAAAGSQQQVKVGSNGTDFLVVWADSRNGSGNQDIYAARVTSAGAVQDTGGIAVANQTSNQSAPAIAWGGSRYFVAWQDRRNGTEYDLFGARVLSNGTVEDPPGIMLGTSAQEDREAAVSFDGTRFLVAWARGMTYPDDRDVLGVRVNGDGSVADSSPIAIANKSFGEFAPAIAFGGGQFAVLLSSAPTGTEDDVDVVLARVAPGGSVTDVTPITVSTAANGGKDARVGFDGTNYLVAWTDYVAGNSWDIWGARVSPAGVVLDPNGIAICSNPARQSEPDVAANAAGFLVAWGDARNQTTSSGDIYAARVSPAGSVLDLNGLAVSTAAGNEHGVSLAASGTSYLAAWVGSSLVRRTLIGTNGSVTAPGGAQLSTESTNQYYAAAASDGTNYVVVWTDARNSALAQIYGSRLDATAARIDTTDVLLSPGASGSDGAVAFGQGLYLIVWGHTPTGGSSDLRAARYSAAGTLLDTSPITLTAAAGTQQVPALTWDGVRFVATWQDQRNSVSGGNNSDVYAGRISKEGLALDADGFPVAASSEREAKPSIASSGSGSSLVAYRRFDPEQPYVIGRVRARLLDGSGAAADAGVDAATDSAADVYPESAADVTTDVSTDATADATADAASDAAADATAEAAADASVGDSAAEGSTDAAVDGATGGAGGSAGAAGGAGAGAGGASGADAGGGGTSAGGAGAGGAGGSAGTVGAGGSSSGGEAGATSGGPGGASSSDEDDGGCGCRAAGAPGSGSFLLALALAGLVRRRRIGRPRRT